MIDALARAAFERFSTDTGQLVSKYPSRFSQTPTTWDKLPPNLQELWREVARAVLRAREDIYKSAKYSPAQIAEGMTSQRPVNTRVLNSPRQADHTSPSGPSVLPAGSRPSKRA